MIYTHTVHIVQPWGKMPALNSTRERTLSELTVPHLFSKSAHCTAGHYVKLMFPE